MERTKKIVWVIFAMVIVACNPVKIGYVDNSELINSLQEKKDIEQTHQLKTQAYSKKRDSLLKILQAEDTAFRQKAQKMSPKKAQEKYQIIAQKQQQFAQELKKEEESINLAGQTAIDSLISKVKKHIKTYAKNNNYTYILGSNEGGSVMYGEHTLDLTELFKKELNDIYKKNSIKKITP